MKRKNKQSREQIKQHQLQQQAQPEGKLTPPDEMLELRVSPEQRLCNKFDEASIAEFRVAPFDDMGVRVADDCAEEHIM